MSMVRPRPCCPGEPQYLGSIDVMQISAAQVAAAAGDFGPAAIVDEENRADREARVSAILSDPNTIPSIRAMVSNPLYGTFVGDALLNNPQVPTPSWVSDADRTAYAQLYGRVWTEAMTRVPPPAPLPAPARYLINGVEQYADGTPVPGGYNAHDDAVRQLAEQGYPNPVVAPDGTVLNPGPPAGPAAVDDPTVTGASFAGVGGGALALLAIAGIAGALMRKRS